MPDNREKRRKFMYRKFKQAAAVILCASMLFSSVPAGTLARAAQMDGETSIAAERETESAAGEETETAAEKETEAAGGPDKTAGEENNGQMPQDAAPDTAAPENMVLDVPAVTEEEPAEEEAAGKDAEPAREVKKRETKILEQGDILKEDEGEEGITKLGSLDELAALSGDDELDSESAYATKRLIVLSDTPEFDTYGAEAVSYGNLYILSYETKKEGVSQ